MYINLIFVAGGSTKCTVYTFVCLFSRTSCICLLVLNWYLVFMPSANTSPNSSAESMHNHKRHQHQTSVTVWTVKAQILSQSNFLGYNLNASQRRHVANCRLNKLHFRYLHISTPTSKWPPPIYFIISIKSKAQGNCRTAAISILT